VTEEQIEKLINSITRSLESFGESEISTEAIGNQVMEHLKELDKVAYIRFASVYRDFKEAKDFEEFVDTLSHRKGE